MTILSRRSTASESVIKDAFAAGRAAYRMDLVGCPHQHSTIEG